MLNAAPDYSDLKKQTATAVKGIVINSDFAPGSEHGTANKNDMTKAAGVLASIDALEQYRLRRKRTNLTAGRRATNPLAPVENYKRPYAPASAARLRTEATLAAHRPTAPTAAAARTQMPKLAATVPAHPSMKISPDERHKRGLAAATRAGLKIIAAAIDPITAVGTVGTAFNSQANPHRAPQRSNNVKAAYRRTGAFLPEYRIG
jgi:hypothetical protein